MRLLYLVSHPIQYQAPLLRRIAAEPDIDLTVLFESLEATGVYHDPGFGADVAWDVPLTDGYDFHPVGASAALAKLLAAADVLWVHGWDSAMRRRALGLAQRQGIPVLMRGENTLAAMPDGGGLRGIAKRLYLGWLFRRCTAFLCIGSDNRDYYAAHGVAADRLFDMPYAVDNAAFGDAARNSDSEALRLDLGLQPGRPVVLFAGKFQARKNAGLLLQAMRGMDRTAARDPYLLFVGDGAERPRLESQAAGEDWIRFLGFRNQTEIPAFYGLADVFVLPSQREPWGLAVNEAMACGTAVVATDECGCAADLVDPACGRVVAAGDAAALAAAITEVVSDPDACQAMGEAARTRIGSWSFREDIAGLKVALNAVA